MPGLNQNNKVPNSGDIFEIAQQMAKLTEGIDKLVPNIQSLINSVAALSKIKTDKLKNVRKNTSSMAIFVKGFAGTINDISKALVKSLDNIDMTELANMLELLHTKELPLGPDGITESGFQNTWKKFGTTKRLGVIDTVSAIVALAGNLSNMKAPDIIKFNREFNKTLKAFKSAYIRIAKFSKGLNYKDIKAAQKVTDILKDVMQELPMSIDLMADMWAKQGKLGKFVAASIGARLILGRRWKKYDPGKGLYRHGLLGATLIFTNTISNSLASGYLKEKDIDTFHKIIKKVNISMVALVGSLAIIAVGAIPAYLGAMALFGVGKIPGIVDLVIRGLQKISNRLKDIEHSAKVALYIAGTIVLLGIAVALMCLTGIMVIKNAPAIGATILFLGVVVFLFWTVTKMERLTREAGWELFIIAGTVALLALTALGLALIGTFVVANWQGFLIVAAYIGVVLLMFGLIAFASKWIEKGGRELLYIAGTVAILALTAMGMALIGQFIEANWEAIGVISLYMIVLIGAFMLVGLATRWIDKGTKALFMIALTVGILAAIAVVIVWVGSLIDVNMAAVIAISIMTLAMAGLVVAIAMLSERIEKGVTATILVVAAVTAIALAMKIFVDTVNSMGGWSGIGQFTVCVAIMGAIVLGLAGIAIGLGTMMATGVGAGIFWAGIAGIAAVTGIILTIGIAMHLMADALRIVNNLAGTPDEMIEKMSIPIGVAILLVGMVGEIPLGQMITATWKIRRLSRMVCNIGEMADVLQHIASLNMPDPDKGYDKNGRPLGWKQMQLNDFTAAAENAGSIIGFFGAIFSDEGKTLSNGVQIKGVLSDIENVKRKHKRKVRFISSIVKSIGEMADVLQHISSLNMPDPDAGYTDDGKPKGWKQMKSDDFMTASQNAGSILSFFGALFADASTPVTFGTTTFMVKPLDTSTLDNMTRSTKRKVKRLGEIVSTIGGMATTIQNVASLNMPDPDKGYDDNGKPKGYIPMGAGEFEQASINIGKIATHIIDAVASENLAAKLEDMSRKAAKNFERIMNPMNSISGIVETIQLLAGGEYVSEWQDDPNNPGQRIPKTYASFSTLLDKKPELTQKLTDMLTIVIGSIAQFSDGDLEDLLDNANDASEDLQDVTENISPILNDIIGIVNETLKLPDLETVKTQAQIPTWVMRHVVWAVSDCDKSIKDSGSSVSSLTSVTKFIGKPNGKGALGVVKDIVDLYNEDISKISDPKTFKAKYTGPTQVARELIESLAGATSSASAQKVQAIQSNIRETIKLMKQVGSTDMSKLKYASTMMNAIARISESIKGNFKELSKTINKDLIKAIKELKKVLDELNKNGIKTGGIGTGTDTGTGTGNEPNIKGANENGSAKLNADRYKNTMKGLNRLYELDDLIDLIASCIDGSGSERSIRTKSTK